MVDEDTFDGDVECCVTDGVESFDVVSEANGDHVMGRALHGDTNRPCASSKFSLYLKKKTSLWSPVCSSELESVDGCSHDWDSRAARSCSSLVFKRDEKGRKQSTSTGTIPSWR